MSLIDPKRKQYAIPQIMTQGERDDEVLMIIAEWKIGGFVGSLTFDGDQLMRLRNAGLITVTVDVTFCGQVRASMLKDGLFHQPEGK